MEHGKCQKICKHRESWISGNEKRVPAESTWQEVEDTTRCPDVKTIASTGPRALERDPKPALSAASTPLHPMPNLTPLQVFGMQFKKRAPRAIKEIKAFAQKQMVRPSILVFPMAAH